MPVRGQHALEATVELLLFVAALVVLDIAANTLGADSRDARAALERERVRDYGWVGAERQRR